MAGAKDPGDVHEPKAARYVERTRILMTARLKEVNQAGSVLAGAYKKQSKEIVIASIAMARSGMAAYEALVLDAGRKLEQASDTRCESFGGLVHASNLTQSVFRFSPHFPAPNRAVLPEIQQIAVKQLCDQLDAYIAKGILFPDPSE